MLGISWNICGEYGVIVKEMVYMHDVCSMLMQCNDWFFDFLSLLTSFSMHWEKFSAGGYIVRFWKMVYQVKPGLWNDRWLCWERQCGNLKANSMTLTLGLGIETRPTLTVEDWNVFDLNTENGVKLDILNSAVGNKVWSTSAMGSGIMIGSGLIQWVKAGTVDINFVTRIQMIINNSNIGVRWLTSTLRPRILVINNSEVVHNR